MCALFFTLSDCAWNDFFICYAVILSHWHAYFLNIWIWVGTSFSSLFAHTHVPLSNPCLRSMVSVRGAFWPLDFPHQGRVNPGGKNSVREETPSENAYLFKEGVLEANFWTHCSFWHPKSGDQVRFGSDPLWGPKIQNGLKTPSHYWACPEEEKRSWSMSRTSQRVRSLRRKPVLKNSYLLKGGVF